MRIAYIGSRGFPGFNAGVEKSLEEICPRLASRGHSITLYCSDHVSTPEPVFRGAILKRMPAFNSKHLETITRVIESGWQAIFEDYDIVHYHSIGPALMSWMTRLARCKTVVTVHGLDWQRAKWGKVARLSLQLGEKASVAFPDATVVVSKFLQRYYRERHNREVVCIPNGVTITAPLAPDIITSRWGLKGSDYILFASRLVPEKECHTLIRAYNRLKTDVRLLIAGASWHSDDYVKTLHDLAGGNPNIIFAGWAEGDILKELFSNAFLYCLPSQIEGLSLSLLEAMSYGICPVVSDIPENTDVVESNGVSFKTGDDADLAAKLQALIDEPARTKSIGLAARQAVGEQYSWDRHAEELEKTYMNLIN